MIFRVNTEGLTTIIIEMQTRIFKRKNEKREVKCIQLLTDPK